MEEKTTAWLEGKKGPLPSSPARCLLKGQSSLGGEKEGRKVEQEWFCSAL
jgi:hypothetical protein